MATPFIQIQNLSAAIFDGSPGSVRVNTFDAAGAPLDVHTGYTLQTFDAAPAAQPNGACPLVDLSGHVSSAFDATGVSISWTAAQAAAMVALLPCVQSQLGIYLSNDGGTTASIAAKVLLSLDAFSLLG